MRGLQPRTPVGERQGAGRGDSPRPAPRVCRIRREYATLRRIVPKDRAQTWDAQ